MILCSKSLANGRHSITLSIVNPVLLWLFAFLLGLQLSYVSDSDLSSLILSAVCQPISVIALLCCRFMPLLLAEIAHAQHRKVLLNCTCLLKAFSYGCTVSLVYLYFQSAGWLIHFLFLFSDTVFCVLHLCLTVSSRRAEHTGTRWRFSLFGFLTGALDYIYISPFLRSLF